MNNIDNNSFKLGYMTFPNWFKDKVRTKDIEIYTNEFNRLECRYYNVHTNKEIIKCYGSWINKCDLYIV